MKNRIITPGICLLMVTFIFLFAVRANAQNTDQYAPKKIEAGIRFLPTFASFKMQTSTGSKVSGKSVVGYAAGTFMGFNFAKHVGMQIEINYSTYSREYKESGITRTINLQYLEIPLLVSFNTGKIRMININAVIGPQIGLNVGSNIKISGDEGLVGPQAVLTLRQGGLGVAYGTGIDFGLNYKRTIRLGVGYRGVIGLLNISNNRETLAPNTYYIMERTALHTYSAYVSLSVLL